MANYPPVVELQWTPFLPRINVPRRTRDLGAESVTVNRRVGNSPRYTPMRTPRLMLIAIPRLYVSNPNLSVLAPRGVLESGREARQNE